MLRSCCLALLLALPGAHAAHAADGDPDPTFSVDGKAFSTWPTRLRNPHVVTDAAGRVYAGVTVQGDDFNFDLGVTRFLANGGPDPGYGTGGKVRIAVDAIAGGEEHLLGMVLLDSGALLLVATVETADLAGAYQPLALVRITAAGNPDTTFGDDGILLLPDNPWPGAETTLTMQAVTRVAGNRLLVSGSLVDGLDNTGLNRIVLRRIGLDGAPDATFGNAGWASMPVDGDFDASAPRIAPSGQIVLAAQKHMLFFGATGWIMRFTAAGAPDTTFGDGAGRLALPDDADGIAPFLHDLRLDSQGRMIVSLGYTPIITDDPTRTHVARLRPDGTPDTTFADAGRIDLTLEDGVAPNMLALRSDGRIVVGGSIDHTGGTRDFYAARLRPDGQLDPGFDGNGVCRVEMNPDFDESARAMTLSAGRPVLVGISGEEPMTIAVLRLESDWMFGDGLE